MKLIIVESPNKIKKIKGYAGSEYEVAASVGHIRDLVVNKETGSIGVDRAHGHALIYAISADKKDVVANLRSKAKAAGPGNVYLATDPDREGEAIAWHLCQAMASTRAPPSASPFRKSPKRPFGPRWPPRA